MKKNSILTFILLPLFIFRLSYGIEIPIKFVEHYDDVSKTMSSIVNQVKSDFETAHTFEGNLIIPDGEVSLGNAIYNRFKGNTIPQVFCLSELHRVTQTSDSNNILSNVSKEDVNVQMLQDNDRLRNPSQSLTGFTPNWIEIKLQFDAPFPKSVLWVEEDEDQVFKFDTLPTLQSFLEAVGIHFSALFERPFPDESSFADRFYDFL